MQIHAPELVMVRETLYALTIAGYTVVGVALLFNLVVIVVFLASKQLRIKYYFFVFTLALTDAVSAAALILLIIIGGVFLRALLEISHTVLRLNVLFVAVNRLLALMITPPARYDTMVTLGRMVVVYVLMWVVSALIYLPLTYTGSPLTIRFIQPLIGLVILTVAAILYLVVFRKIASYRPPLASTSGISEKDEQTGTRIRQTRHLMITFTLILAVSCLCWLPAAVASFMMYFSSSGNALDLGNGFLVYFRFSALFAISYSAINPFIYWWRLAEFREALYGMICCWRTKPSAVSAEASISMETVVEQAK
ncbi:sphingosine 1-phosphate receptor 2-like [Acanthaster planci]|uniref:Sphingosine 1-phosphate receptor 2-like n=1 Tax=Acanthaster planci TaxID=133434 RepID=A0A8B7ZVG1_ACAPL|nr:sphingosine 1-phosphate receptor 2-like [Acanthaster planci]